MKRMSMPAQQCRLNRRKGLQALALLTASGMPTWLLAQSSSTHPRANPPRAISVGAGATEIAYALGAQSQLVAVDTSSLYPAQARKLPQVGYQRSLSAEGVLSLAPQVLLAGDDAGPPPVLRQIEAAGVRVVPVRGDYSMDGVLARVRATAQALDRVPEGDKLVADLTRQWQDVQAQIAAEPLRGPDKQPLKVAFLMRHGTMTLAAGDGTPADALLRMAGVKNAFSGSIQGFKPLSAEALAQAAPDAIVSTSDGEPKPEDRAALLATPGLDLTPAGRTGRAAVLDIVLLLSFGPRLPQAVQALRKALRA